MTFTYHHMRDDVKMRIMAQPASMMLPWLVEYINQQLASLPAGSIVVELGTFAGGTTALLARSNPGLVIHTYDHNKFDDYGTINAMLPAMRERYDLPLLQPSDIVELQRMHLEDYHNVTMHVADTLGIKETNIGLALVDDNRGEDETLEILRYLWPRMAKAGIIIGDDVDTPHVYNAFARFAKEQNVELTIYSKCAKLVKEDRMPSNRDMGYIDTLLNSSRWEYCHKA